MAPEKKTESATTQHPCGHCGEKASLGCGQCKNVMYCTPECQQADWQFHKSICKKYVQVTQKGRPDVNTRLAIVIEEGESEPDFLWMPVETGTKVVADDDDSDILGALAHDLDVPVTDPTSDTVLQTDDNWAGKAIKVGIPEMLVCGKQGSGNLLKYSIHVATRQATSNKGPPNKFLAQIFGEKVASRYRGNTCLFAKTKVYDSSIIADIDTRGFTLALNALDKRTNLRQTQRIKTNGVRVNATRPHYEPIMIPTRHPIFTRGSVATVARMLDEGLLTFKALPDPKKPAPGVLPAPDGAANPAAWLHLQCHHASPDYGSIPAAARADTGSMLVVNAVDDEDGSPGRLSVLMLKSLIGIIKWEVGFHLSDETRHPIERGIAVAMFVQAIKSQAILPLKKGLRERARDLGYESDESDFEEKLDRDAKESARTGKGPRRARGERTRGKGNGAKACGSKADDGKPGAKAEEDRCLKDGDGPGEDDASDDVVTARASYLMSKAFLKW